MRIGHEFGTSESILLLKLATLTLRAETTLLMRAIVLTMGILGAPYIGAQKSFLKWFPQ